MEAYLIPPLVNVDDFSSLVWMERTVSSHLLSSISRFKLAYPENLGSKQGIVAEKFILRRQNTHRIASEWNWVEIDYKQDAETLKIRIILYSRANISVPPEMGILTHLLYKTSLPPMAKGLLRVSGPNFKFVFEYYLKQLSNQTLILVYLYTFGNGRAE